MINTKHRWPIFRNIDSTTGSTSSADCGYVDTNYSLPSDKEDAAIESRLAAGTPPTESVLPAVPAEGVSKDDPFTRDELAAGNAWGQGCTRVCICCCSGSDTSADVVIIGGKDMPTLLSGEEGEFSSPQPLFTMREGTDIFIPLPSLAGIGVDVVLAVLAAVWGGSCKVPVDTDDVITIPAGGFSLAAALASADWLFLFMPLRRALNPFACKAWNLDLTLSLSTMRCCWLGTDDLRIASFCLQSVKFWAG